MPWIQADMQWFVDDTKYNPIQSDEDERVGGVGGVVRRADNNRLVKRLRIGKNVKQPQQPTTPPNPATAYAGCRRSECVPE